MQSIRQYRCLREHVEANLALGQNKAQRDLRVDPEALVGLPREAFRLSDPQRELQHTQQQQERQRERRAEENYDIQQREEQEHGEEGREEREEEREEELEQEQEREREEEQERERELEEEEEENQQRQRSHGSYNPQVQASADPEPPELHVHKTCSTSRGGQVRLDAVLGVHIREKTPEEGGDGVKKVFLVYYMGQDDETDAHSWSYARRMTATIIISVISAVVGFASAIDSAAINQAMIAFGVNQVVESLATSLYLIGFGIGALFAGPISETVGRNPVYIITLVLFMVWIMASGLAPNIQSQAIFRLLAGLFGSTPLVCAGGSLADIWSPSEQVSMFPIFAIFSFAGPALGPVVGGFIGESPLVSWRWVSWITLIISGLTLAAVIFLLPESYTPVMLKWKAHHLRKLTGDQRYQAKIETGNTSFGQMILRSLGSPFVLTFTEPIVFLVAIYLTVIYIIFFTFLNGFTFIFTNTYGFSQGLTGLCFLGEAIGFCIAACFVPLVARLYRSDLYHAEKAGFTSTAPESHLYFSLITAPAITISLFWMAWTTDPSISYWSPLAASVLFGYGIIGVFISCYQYIIASYDIYAASALASVTFIRYVVSGGMVEVAIPWYTNLGVAWTLSILGFVSAILVPVPFVFYRYGYLIRQKSKYAFT